MYISRVCPSPWHLFLTYWVVPVLYLVGKCHPSLASIHHTRSPLISDTLSTLPPHTHTQVLEPMHCHPIFLPEELIHGHYHGYCKTVMWPLFHNVEMLDSCGCVNHACRSSRRDIFMDFSD